MGSLFSKRRRKKDKEGGASSSSSAGGGGGGGGDPADDFPLVVTKIAILGPKGAGKRTLCESYCGTDAGYFDLKERFCGKLSSFTVQVGADTPPAAAAIRGNMGVLVVFDAHSEDSLNAGPSGVEPAAEIANAVHTRGMRNHSLFLVANRRADAVGAPVPRPAVNKVVSDSKAKLLEVDGADRQKVQALFQDVFTTVVDTIINAPPLHTISL